MSTLRDRTPAATSCRRFASIKSMCPKSANASGNKCSNSRLTSEPTSKQHWPIAGPIATSSSLRFSAAQVSQFLHSNACNIRSATSPAGVYGRHHLCPGGPDQNRNAIGRSNPYPKSQGVGHNCVTLLSIFQRNHAVSPNDVGRVYLSHAPILSRPVAGELRAESMIQPGLLRKKR